LIGEQLTADYGRKGFVRARNVRLMTVSVRPGRPNGAASGFLSGMIREPLAGVQAMVPVARSTAVALSSPERTVQGLIRAAQASDGDWGALTAINLPALSTTVDEMASALELIAGPAGISLLKWQIDPQIQKIVATWPARVASPRAQALGLTADTDFASIVRSYVRENAQSVKLGISA
jgi:D-erythronate 2-dehydrogenase